MAKTSTFLKDKDKAAVEEKFTMRKERAVIYKQGQSEEGTQSSHSPTADILGCEGKRTLRSITMTKASGGDGIPAELFQTLKDDAVKVLHLICQQIWKTQQWSQDWKGSVFILIPKKGNAKACTNYVQTNAKAQFKSISSSALSVPIQIPLISFSCLTVATTSNAMLNKSGENGNLVLFLILEEMFLAFHC